METETTETAKEIGEGIGMVMENENARKAGTGIGTGIGSATGTETAIGETKKTAIVTAKNREVKPVIPPLLSSMSGIYRRVPIQGIVMVIPLPKTRLENGAARWKMM
jgi:hypothetical protein